MNDDELITRIRNGDTTGFDELINRYKEMAYYLALDILGDHEDAEDISQQAFIKAFRGIRRFKGKATFKTWFTKILMNLCRSHLRRRSLISRFVDSRKDEEIEDERWEVDPVEVTMELELSRSITRAIDSLSGRQREIFILKHLHGLKIREIAEILGCRESTIKVQLFRAIRNLKTRLKGWEDEM
jgi:RNA polymerase sigma-70 factor (ECF subfamily)